MSGTLGSDDPFSRLRAHFEACVELATPAERDRYIAENCPPELRERLRALLFAHHGGGTFFAAPIAGEAGANNPADPLIGARVGGYTIHEAVGVGGMGVVYRARQETPARTVALKVMRSHDRSAPLLQRFAHEAQALGRLNHPGIAHIYEAGTATGPDGRRFPFFAMEFVTGEPLLTYASARRLDPRDRMELVALIADAVHHAHTKGVIHRDLKPANILVEPGNDASSVGSRTGTTSAWSGARHRPRILDFGVARLLDPNLERATIQTTAGQVLGTVPYMSPEQIRGDADQIDTRTDVYALGVILYELLCGTLPYDVRGKPIAQAALVISTQAPTPPDRHDRSLRGDPATILLKALEKEPHRRYASAADLAGDIRRHLADLPITARPPSTAEQFRKFARRNKALVGGIAASVFLLLAGIVGTSLGLLRARANQKLAETREQQANLAARTAENSEQFLISMLTAANPQVSRNRELTVRELLDEAALRVDTQLSEEPAVALRTRIALGRTYVSLNAGPQALRQADKAMELATGVFGERSVERSLALSLRAAARRLSADAIGATDDFRESLGLLESLLPPDDPQIARAQTELGNQLVRAGKFEEAESLLSKAKASLDARQDPAAPATTVALASLLLRARPPSELEPIRTMLEAALAEARRGGASAQAHAADILVTLADLERRTKNPEAAIPHQREALALRAGIYPEHHPTLLGTRLALARGLRTARQLDEAIGILDAMNEPIERVFGRQSSMYADLHRERAAALISVERCPEAELSARIVVEALPPRELAIHVIVAYSQLAKTMECQRRWSDAAQTYQQAIDKARDVGASITSISTLVRAKALALTEAGEHARARQELRAGMAAVADNDAHALIRSDMHELLARVEVADGNLREAIAHARSAIEASQPHDAAWAAEQCQTLIGLLERAGDQAAAEAERERLKRLLPASPPQSPPQSPR